MKRTPLKRKSKRLGPGDRDAASAWARHAKRRVCALCSAPNPHGHHVIYLQELKRVIRSHNLEDRRQGILYDRRNLLPLCERHHAAHHSGAHPLTLTIVRSACPKVDQFAAELGLDWWLERYYR
jgi:hypothetical protein